MTVSYLISRHIRCSSIYSPISMSLSQWRQFHFIVMNETRIYGLDFHGSLFHTEYNAFFFRSVTLYTEKNTFNYNVDV